jgi:hypothetical protein
VHFQVRCLDLAAEAIRIEGACVAQLAASMLRTSATASARNISLAALVRDAAHIEERIERSKCSGV